MSSPLKVKWQAEKARHQALVVRQAQRALGHAKNQLEQHSERLRAHDRDRPAPPSGLLAGFKQAAHEKAFARWAGERVALDKRWQQLSQRTRGIEEGYVRAAPSYGAPSRGDRLIDAKAAAARPELAQQYRGVQAREQAQAEKAQKARSAELAERFKTKVREDREQERGGRGGGRDGGRSRGGGRGHGR